MALKSVQTFLLEITDVLFLTKFIFYQIYQVVSSVLIFLISLDHWILMMILFIPATFIFFLCLHVYATHFFYFSYYIAEASVNVFLSFHTQGHHIDSPEFKCYIPAICRTFPFESSSSPQTHHAIRYNLFFTIIYLSPQLYPPIIFLFKNPEISWLILSITESALNFLLLL